MSWCDGESSSSSAGLDCGGFLLLLLVVVVLRPSRLLPVVLAVLVLGRVEDAL